MSGKKYKKLHIGIMTTGMLLALNGCAGIDVAKTNASTDRTSVMQGETISTAEAVIQENEKATQSAERQESCIIQEDEQYLYFCGGYRVSKVDKETGEEVILWENADMAATQDEYLYSRGTGLLIDNRIYFIEVWNDAEDNQQRAISCVGIDGTGYEQIIDIKYSASDIMLWQDGMLYVDDLDREIWLKKGEDGKLSEPEIHERGYQEKIYYTDNGERVLFEQESLAEFGFYLKQMTDGYVVAVNPDTGEEENLPQLTFLSGYNSTYFLVSTYKDGMSLSLVERESGKELELLAQEERFMVVGLDEEYVYIERYLYEGENTNYSYERIRLEDGEREVLFVRYPSLLMTYDADILMDVVIWNGYLYYIEVQDYNFYRMRRSLDAPEEAEIVGEVVYDTGIAAVGGIESYQEHMYSEEEPEHLLFNLDLTWLSVDDKYPGSNLINSYLIAEQEANMSYAREQYEWIKEEGEVINNSTLVSSFSGFSYRDSHYISFVQEEYQYLGGAHGMPWWIGHTFDLESGERMLLSDMVYNSEEELKQIVSGYFAELINSQPAGNYWDDAVEYVYESVSYESDCYLTEEGIVFYYGPYELACYAAGFQEVTIPYEEFDMRIILENGN